MFVAAKELVGIVGMPVTTKGIRQALDRAVNGSPALYRKREGSKAFEYHISCLPVVAREAVLTRHYNSVLASPSELTKPAVTKTCPSKTKIELELARQCPALLESKLGELTEKQKGIADSRMALVMEVLRLECQAGLSRIRAIRLIVSQAQEGILPAHLLQHVEKANARKGAHRTIGERSLNQWVVDYLRAEDSAERLMLLSPGHHKAKKAQDIAWLPMFLAIYRQPKGESVAECYRQFCKQWAEMYADQPAMLGAVPLIDAVQRALDKLPKNVLLRGRVTGAAWRALQTYVKRDWSQLTVNDVWIGDGHGLKMKVAHPIHGQPFIPEVTMILDGVTRYVVGWSVSLSENTVAVADALRYGMSRNGLPLFYYSDNGGGEKNKIFDADVTGIFPRLGIGHELGIPGNPQGRGIIERAHKTILYRIAAQFATFHGSSADRDHVRITSRQINSAVNAQNQGKELNATQRNAMAKLPSWNQLIDALEDGIEWYNTQHRHSELPKKNGKHYTPAEYRAELLEGKLGTIVPAKWLNDMQGATQTTQSEILTVLQNAGIQAIEPKNDQLFTAIDKLVTIKTPPATTFNVGTVQLNDSVTSDSRTQAATPSAVKMAYDLASQRQPAGNYADGNIFAVGDTETSVFNPNKNLYFLCNNSNVSGVASIQYGMIWGFDGAGRLTVGKVPTSQIEGIVQTTGASTQNIMSQKATTDAINITASVGVNQSWINMTASRTPGVNYTNTTGRPICVILNVKNTLAGLWASNITVSGLEISAGSTTAGEHRSIFAVIHPGALYSYNPLASSGAAMWELR